MFRKYGVGVDICPPRRGNRKGVVEKANHSAAQRWWRTVPDALSVSQAQSGIDKLAARMDERRRSLDGLVVTVGELAAVVPLLDIPVRPFPAEPEVDRTVSPQCLVSFDGNLYSVPPGLAGAQVRVRHRLSGDDLDIATAGRPVIGWCPSSWCTGSAAGSARASARGALPRVSTAPSTGGGPSRNSPW